MAPNANIMTLRFIHLRYAKNANDIAHDTCDSVMSQCMTSQRTLYKRGFLIIVSHKEC